MNIRIKITAAPPMLLTAATALAQSGDPDYAVKMVLAIHHWLRHPQEPQWA
jgi:hypothetical protein